MGLAALGRRVIQDQSELCKYKADLETSWLPLKDQLHGKLSFPWWCPAVVRCLSKRGTTAGFSAFGQQNSIEQRDAPAVLL